MAIHRERQIAKHLLCISVHLGFGDDPVRIGIDAREPGGNTATPESGESADATCSRDGGRLQASSSLREGRRSHREKNRSRDGEARPHRAVSLRP